MAGHSSTEVGGWSIEQTTSTTRSYQLRAFEKNPDGTPNYAAEIDLTIMALTAFMGGSALACSAASGWWVVTVVAPTGKADMELETFLDGAQATTGRAIFDDVVDEESALTVELTPHVPVGVVLATTLVAGGGGGGGVAPFTYTQSFPSATWIITHNLGARPIVQAFTDGGQPVDTDVAHGSTNVTTLTFATPTMGVAYLYLS